MCGVWRLGSEASALWVQLEVPVPHLISEKTQKKHKLGTGGKSLILNLRCISGNSQETGFSCSKSPLRYQCPMQRGGEDYLASGTHT